MNNPLLDLIHHLRLQFGFHLLTHSLIFKQITLIDNGELTVPFSFHNSRPNGYTPTPMGHDLTEFYREALKFEISLRYHEIPSHPELIKYYRWTHADEKTEVKWSLDDPYQPYY